MRINSSTVIREYKGTFAFETMELATSAAAVGGLAWALQEIDFNRSFAVLCRYVHQPNVLKGFDLDALAIAIVVAVAAILVVWTMLASPHGPGSTYYPQLRRGLWPALLALSVPIEVLAMVAAAGAALPFVFEKAKSTADPVVSWVLLASFVAATVVGIAFAFAKFRPKAGEAGRVGKEGLPIGRWCLFTAGMFGCCLGLAFVGLTVALGFQTGVFPLLAKDTVVVFGQAVSAVVMGAAIAVAGVFALITLPFWLWLLGFLSRFM